MIDTPEKRETDNRSLTDMQFKNGFEDTLHNT